MIFCSRWCRKGEGGEKNKPSKLEDYIVNQALNFRDAPSKLSSSSLLSGPVTPSRDESDGSGPLASQGHREASAR